MTAILLASSPNDCNNAVMTTTAAPATTTISLYADPNVGGLAYFFEDGAIGTCSGPAGPARDRDADLTDDFHSACIDLIEAGVAGQGDVSTTGAGENGLLGCITVTDAAEAARILEAL